MKKLFLMLAAALLMTAPAYAQTSPLVGKWTATTQGQQGPQKMDLEIKTAAGGKLTGTISGGMGGAVEISDGTVAGAKASFVQAMSPQPGMDLKIKYTGEVAGDKLTMAREISGLPEGMAPPGGVPPVEFTRVK